MTTLGLAFRLVLSLTVVVGVMWLAARVLRKKVGMGPAKRGKGETIQVLARRGVHKNAAVAVVQVGAQVLVLGITEHNVNVLTEADPASIEPIDLTDQTAGSNQGNGRMPLPVPGAARGPFTAWKLLESLRERTVRR